METWFADGVRTLSGLGSGDADNPDPSGRLKLYRQVTGGADWQLVLDCPLFCEVRDVSIDEGGPAFGEDVRAIVVADVAKAVQHNAAGPDRKSTRLNSSH